MTLSGTNRPSLPSIGKARTCIASIALAIGVPVPVAQAQSATVAQDRELDFAIEAQPLAAALDAYSLATGIQLFYASALTRGLRSTAVVGRYTSQEAILTLLQGTGLRPRLTASNAITLDALPSAAGKIVAAEGPGNKSGASYPSTNDSLRLGTLRVHAEQRPAASRRYRLYADAVRRAVARSLRRTKRLRERNYRIQLSIWLSRRGRIVRSAVFRSSGDTAIDGIVVETLDAVVVRPDPPRGMPQPIHIDMRAAGA